MSDTIEKPDASKRFALVILLLGIIIPIVAWLAFVRWDTGAFPGFVPELVDVTTENINREHRGVRIHGMARFDVKFKQKIGEKTYYVFPLVSKEDMNSKTIRVMVLSPTPPGELIGIEERTVEGIARPPGRLMPRDIINSWQDLGYQFDEKFVMVHELERE